MVKKSLKRRGGQQEGVFDAREMIRLQNINRRIANGERPLYNLQPQESYVPVPWEQQKKDIEAESIRRRQVIDASKRLNARTEKYIDEERARQSRDVDVEVGAPEGDLVDNVQEGDVQYGDVEEDIVEDDLEEWEKDSIIQQLNKQLQVRKDHYGENYSKDKYGNHLKPGKKKSNKIKAELAKYSGGKSKSNKRKSNKRKSKARKSRKQRK